MSEPNPDLSDRFLSAFYGNRRGWACLGYKPQEQPSGQSERIEQRWFRWPDETDRAIAWIEDMGPRYALYWNPFLRTECERRKGNALGHRWLWLDLDGPPGDADLVAELGGITIRSGRPGHTHLYIALSQALDADAWHSLARALRDAVGGAADPKIADNDLLRLPGSLNFRTDPPTVVTVR